MRKFKFLVALLILTYLEPGAIAQAPGFPGKGRIEIWQKATVFFNQGIDFSRSKEYAKAAGKYRKAISIYPYDAGFYNNLSFVLEHTADPKGGEEAARKAISLEPKSWGAWENLGNCLYDQNKLTESKAAFTEALQCSPPSKRRTNYQTVLSILDSKIKAENIKHSK